MAIGASVTVDISSLNRRMKKLQRGFEPKQLLQAIANAQIKWIDGNFKAEGIEKKWRPLSPVTIARRRKGPNASISDKILQDTGKLKGSFNTGKPGNVFKLTNKEVTVGSNVQYAATHEHGRGKVPQRKILPTNATARKHAKKTLEGIVRDLARGAR